MRSLLVVLIFPKVLVMLAIPLKSSDLDLILKETEGPGDLWSDEWMLSD